MTIMNSIFRAAIANLRNFSAGARQVAGLLSCVACVTASAATFYVDFDEGSNSNSGTSPSAPWKHAPGDSNATGNPAAKNLVGGDSVIFKGGVSYNGTVILRWNGSVANPITYDGNSSGTWGQGRATITTLNGGLGVGMSSSSYSRSHITIKHLRFYDIGGYADNDPIWLTTTPVTSPPGGTGISITAGGSDIAITDCLFEEIGQWINAVPMSGTVSITGTGINLQNVQNATIADCEFTKLRAGVSIKANADGIVGPVTVLNSRFHDYLVWCIDVAPRKAGVRLTDITIDGCHFYNYSQYDSGNWKGLGEKPHRDGIFFRTSGMQSTWENIVVRNCRFWDDKPEATNGGTASIYVSQGPSVSIHNNVFLNDRQANGHISIGGANLTPNQSVLIKNNTFVGPTRPIYISESCNSDTISITNNAFYRHGSTASLSALYAVTSNVKTFISNTNLYYSDQDLNKWNAVFDGGYLTFAAWQAKGHETSGILAKPDFVSTTGLPSTWNVQAQSTSSLLITKAIGAYVSATLSPLMSPSNLVIIVQ